MGKTTEVATDRAYDATKTVLPVEMARGVYMQNAPGLAALKLLHLLIAKAGGRMGEDCEHRIRLSEIRATAGLKNHDRASLSSLFGELQAAVLFFDDKQKKRLTIGGLVDIAEVDYRDEETGDLLVCWYFSRFFTRAARESNHWAIIDRQTVFHLTSKYSILLFQHISSLTPLSRISSQTFKIPELRAVFALETGKVSRFANLRADILEPALDEISKLSRFTLSATLHKTGRTVTSVEISWQEKPDLQPVKAELETSKVGRSARLNGTTETIVAPPALPAQDPLAAFPVTGSINYSPAWIALKHEMGCNMDNTMIAHEFRRFCQSKGIPLNARNIVETFKGFCRSIGAV